MVRQSLDGVADIAWVGAEAADKYDVSHGLKNPINLLDSSVALESTQDTVLFHS